VRRQPKLSTAIAWVAWATYAVAFFLPTIPLGPDNRLEAGWKAALIALYAPLLIREAPLEGTLLLFGDVTNVLMLLSPVLFARRFGPRGLGRAAAGMIAAAIGNALWIPLMLSRKPDFGPGYYVWAASFGVIAIALFVRAREASAQTF
jgi:hypothetical protein